MTQDELKAAITAGATEAFSLFGQPASWNGTTYTVILDALPYSDEMRSEGGGLLSDFHGMIIFNKADFTDRLPRIGDIVTVNKRVIRLKEISTAEDPADPTLSFAYAATNV